MYITRAFINLKKKIYFICIHIIPMNNFAK